MSSPPPLRFGPGGRFELRPAEYRLLVDGAPAPLGGRALDLLLVLAARAGELVTKAELLERVWPGLVVEENNLRVQVNGLRRVLGDDAIATVPGRGYRFSAVVQADAPAAAGAAPASTAETAAGPAVSPAAHLPRLFGRAGDLARLEPALQAAAAGCFVTLVGTSGVGKSSLARLAAARWHGDARWIDLAPLAHANEVAGAVGRALQRHVDPADGVPLPWRGSADGRPTLLVLDNAEHVLQGCAALAPRIAGAPGLRLLVTSQAALGLAGEQVQSLDPLAVADDGDALEGALAMLVDRIGSADHRFRLTPASRPLLAAICRQLDGLPLALEMAAARVPLMGPQAVHDALDERFALLSRGRRDAPSRHRRLLDALDWSYGLLAPPERQLFRALGVFAGGFTLDLALTVALDEHVGRWDVVDGLATLVERSLVTVSADDPPRYRLLETMRAYAIEQQAAAGSSERASLRRRHASAVLAIFLQAGSDDQALAEMENAQEAFRWAREHDLDIAARLSTRAALAIGFSVWRQEVTAWMRSLEPQMRSAPGQALPAETQASWWSMLAYVLNVRRDPAARPAAVQAVALWRPLGQPLRLQAALAHWVRSLHEPGPELDQACAELAASAAGDPQDPDVRLRVNGALAEAARVRADPAALLACREAELAVAREQGWSRFAQAALSNVCAALALAGRHAEAAERAAALLAQIDADEGDANGNLPWALNVRVESLVALGRGDAARALLPRALQADRRFGTAVAWQGILRLALAEGRLTEGARLAGHVRQTWADSGLTPDRDELARVDEVLRAAAGALGGEVATALAAEGRWMGEAAAVKLALAP